MSWLLGRIGLSSHLGYPLVRNSVSFLLRGRAPFSALSFPFSYILFCSIWMFLREVLSHVITYVFLAVRESRAHASKNTSNYIVAVDIRIAAIVARLGSLAFLCMLVSFVFARISSSAFLGTREYSLF